MSEDGWVSPGRPRPTPPHPPARQEPVPDGAHRTRPQAPGPQAPGPQAPGPYPSAVRPPTAPDTAPAAPPGPGGGWYPDPYYAQGWQAAVPAAPPVRRSRRRPLLVVGGVLLALVAVVVVLGVRTWLESRPLGDVTGPVDAHPGRLRPGHCVAALPDDGPVTGVRVVPCDTPHDAEVVGRLELPASDWPGQDAVDERLTSWCAMDNAEREAGFRPVVWGPTERGWGRGDRVGLCLAWLPEGGARGSFTAGEQVTVG